MVLKKSPLRFRGYSSFDQIKDPRNRNRFISEGHEDFIPLISNEDPDSHLNLNQLEEDEDDSSGPTRSTGSSDPVDPEDDSSRSTGSDDSYYSSNTSIPTKKDKKVFFNILKHLLEDQRILQEGNEEERWCGNDKLKLIYMGRECKALILDGGGKEIWEQIVETKSIYLDWRGDEVEPLSLENLQIVQNELKFLGIQSEQVDACFSFARTKFMEESNIVQENTTLKIICRKVSLTFGKGKNLATVLYDDIEKIPKYNMKIAHWYTKLYRNVRSLVTKWRSLTQCVSDTGSSLQWLSRLQPWCSKYKQL